MAKRTVRIKIPVGEPDKFSKLGNDIKKQDADLGAASPLNNDPNFNRADFLAKLAEGDSFREQSEALRGQAETLMEKANNCYGLGKGQTALTPGTVYNYVINSKNYLLPINNTNPEALTLWGYDVVVGTAKSPTKKVAK